ncbi:MAG: sulfatase-like hydrolase/transferase [Kiritimatiellia bacterium]|nr:sulfatase-like hydrolase/transferase [Lentisphaerota bacterium]
MAEQVKNILYIMTDQQRYDSLGLAGQSICRTPCLDRLAARGVNFSNAYSVCALCTPARASMLTGLYPHKHKLLINQDHQHPVADEFPDHIRLISNDLKDAGYNCGYAGKWHCGTTKVPSTYGFEGMDVPGYGSHQRNPYILEYQRRNGLAPPELLECIPESARASNKLTGTTGTFSGPPQACEPWFTAEYSIDLMRRYADAYQTAGKPFMMFTSFWGPHHPCNVPEPYASMYLPKDVRLWGSFYDDLKSKPRAQQIFRDSIYPGGKDLDEATWKKMIAKYWGLCSFVDSQVGRLVEALEELGLADSTAILFSSDHGDTCGCHGGLWDKGPFMYEDTYHIPLIASVPGLGQPGTTCDKFVLNMDLATTALALAGVPPADGHDGRSLLPLMADPAADWPDDVMCEFHGHRFLYTQRMLRWRDYKYVFNAADFDELYDLAGDPSEMNNLIADDGYRSVAEECRQRLLAWIKRTDDVFDICAADFLNERAATAGLQPAGRLA